MKKNVSINLLYIIAVAGLIILSLYLLRAPKSVSSTADTKEFSAERAFEHTKNIAQQPHMIGTTEHSNVKQYIIDKANELGLETGVQQTTAIYEFRGVVRAGFVQNIIATLKGTGSDKSVLIVGHYDSQPNAPGAADDGSAVAAMLEAARALKQNTSLKNDIIFLFTDAEEVGLLGAKAFVDEHHLADKIGVVLNIEARGNKGPSITFEVSPENGWIMREFVKAVSHPVAHSIAYEVYKILPNDTDFTIFKKDGISGFNTALTDGYANYHSPTDKPENLSLASLQHHGSYIMDIARHFGNIDLTSTKSKDVVFFNILGYVMVLYPVSFNIFLIVLVSVLLALYLFIAIRKKRITILKMLAGILIFVITLALVIGMAWLLQKGLIKKYPHYTLHYYWNFYNINHYFVAFTAFSVALFSFIYLLLHKKPGIQNLYAGVIFVAVVAMFALQKYFPTGSYLFIIPLLFILISTIICYLFNFDIQKPKGLYFLVHLIFLFPVISLFVPLINMFYVAFGLKLIFAGVALTVILSGFLISFLIAFYEYKKWLLPILALLIGIISIISGHIKSDFNEKQPLLSNVMYCLDANTSNAFWVSENLRTDIWNRQFFTEARTEPLKDIYPFSEKNRLIGKAPVLELPKPEIFIESDSIKETGRNIEMCIKSNRDAQYFEIFIHKNAQLSELKINSHPIVLKEFYDTSKTNYYSIYYFGIYESGCKLTLNCNSKDKFEFIVIEKKMGLPIPEGFDPRPKSIIADKDYNSNLSLVKYSFEL